MVFSQVFFSFDEDVFYQVKEVFSILSLLDFYYEEHGMLSNDFSPLFCFSDLKIHYCELH